MSTLPGTRATLSFTGQPTRLTPHPSPLLCVPQLYTTMHTSAAIASNKAVLGATGLLAVLTISTFLLTKDGAPNAAGGGGGGGGGGCAGG